MNFFKISNGKNIKYEVFTTKNYTFINNTSKNTSINIIDKVLDYYINNKENGIRVVPKTRTRKK